MQYLDDDMDEVFRRAAESYPLNTGAADWDAVRKGLSPNDGYEPPAPNRYRFLWTLLLLPLTLICNRTIDSGSRSQSNGEAQASKTSVESKAIAAQMASQQNGVAASPSSASIAAVANEEEKPLTALNLKTKLRCYQSGKFLTTPKDYESKYKLPQKKNTSTAVSLEKESLSKNNETEQEGSAASHSETNETQAKETVIVANKEPTVAPSDSSQISSKESVSPPVKAKANKQKHFYLGLVGGPDISTVKFRKFSQVGFQAGFVAGYQLNRKVSIEAGVFTSKKFYYSRGEDFNSTELYLPYNTKILAVNGNCRMYELPLSLRYNFGQVTSHSWAVSAGLSSYLMRKEAYDFDYLYASSGTVVTHSKTYENKTKNWLSVLQLSVGYNASIGPVGSLRMEPYWAIPLKGIGYGALPLHSFGIRLGITSKRF